MSENTPNIPSPSVDASLFGALPWPSAALDRNGLILSANPAFLLHFPACRPGATGFDDLFEPDESEGANAAPKTAATWQGMRKALPGASDARFRLIINADPASPDRRWLFLPDNTVMHGKALLTPRSEFEITRMVLEHTPDFLFLREPSGGLIFASRALTRFLRSPAEGYEVGRPLTNFLSHETALEIARLDKETLEKRETVNRSRMNFATPGGVRVTLDLSQEPVFNAAGNLVGLLTFGRDITTNIVRENRLHLALEDSRAAGEAKAFFVANVSHEIRTPINGILGMAELCLDTPLMPDQRKYVQAVLDCGRTLLTLVNDILDFSKVEAGHMTFEKIEFDIARLLSDTAAQFAPRAYARRVEMVLDADPALPARVKGDPTRIRQVVTNLVSNAVKFTEQGHVVVSSRVLAKDGDTVRICIDIADTGIGIPPEKQSSIFEAFTQADSSTTRRFGGTGLGLAICKRITEMMGGTLSVNSHTGVGSVFTAEIPLEVASSEDITHGAPLHLKRVGVVSDDPVQRESLARLYRGLGAEVFESQAGVEAFRLFIREPGATPPVQLLVADYPVAADKPGDMTDLLVGRGASGGIPVITLGAIKTEPAVLSRLRSMPHRHFSKPAGHHELRSASLALLGVEDLAQPHETSDAEPLSARRLRVLLAEDNPVNQELALRRLEKLGHQVDLAEDGGKAWNLLTTKRYDIAFLDVQMPVLDGLRLAKRIREMEGPSAAKHRLPLIALTALAMDSDRKECFVAGFDAMLTKPFLTDDLRKIIARFAPDAAVPVAKGETPMARSNVTRPPIPRRETYDFEAVLRPLPEDEAEDLRLAGEVFLDYWEKEAVSLRDAWDLGEPSVIALIAHRIKGGAGSLRGRTAVELCEKLEAAAKASNMDEAGALLRKLVDELHGMADAIRRVIDSGKTSS